MSLPLLRTLLLAIAVAVGFAPLPARAASAASDDLVAASLLAEPAAIAPGEPFFVAIRLRMKEHWHTYWRNPGDSGLATEVKWTLPQGFTAGDILWPVPARIPVGHLVNFGYEGEVMLLTRITPPRDLPPGDVPLKADVSWLVCQKECIPGEATLSLTVPGSAGGPAVAGADNAGVFAAARAKLPQPAPWPARLSHSDDGMSLRIDAKGLDRARVRSVLFFPFSETAIVHAAPQPATFDADGVTLALKRSTLATDRPASLDGLLLIEEATDTGVARHGFEIIDAARSASAPAALAQATPRAAGAGDWLWAALLAFGGGILLNLMPCVFPVLSIKVLSLVQHSGEPAGRVRLHGLSYTAGVLASFGVLAALLLALRAADSEIGWGFQLQSPVVVAVLAFVMFAMGLSLVGALTLGTSLAGIGDGLMRRGGLSGSFFAGVLATVVATPCTAPFMGAAIGLAVTQPAPVALAIFAALGLGLALPFLLLTFAPALHRRLPRPGAWMETLKQALAFPLFATAAWLVWVLAQQVGSTGLLAALIGLVLIGLAAWLWEHARVSDGRAQVVWRGAALASLAGLVAASVAIGRDAPAASSMALAGSSTRGFEEPFSQARLDALRAENRPVFVNMTAAWCITCLVNERVALSTEAVRDAFRRGGIVYLKGDWTNRNPEITRVLQQHGRSGVPLYVLYLPGQEPLVLPQILTESTVLEPLAGLPARQATNPPDPQQERRS